MSGAHTRLLCCAGRRRAGRVGVGCEHVESGVGALQLAREPKMLATITCPSSRLCRRCTARTQLEACIPRGALDDVLSLFVSDASGAARVPLLLTATSTPAVVTAGRSRKAVRVLVMRLAGPQKRLAEVPRVSTVSAHTERW